MNGQVINQFMRIIERRSCFYKHLPSVWALDSTFLSSWEQDPTRFAELNRNMLARDYIFIPVHLTRIGPRGHWALIVVQPKSFKIEAFDSENMSRSDEMRTVIAFLLEFYAYRGQPFDSEAWTRKQTYIGTRIYLDQEDFKSSGVWVCVAADLLTRNTPITYGHRSVVTDRRTIRQVLRQKRFKKEVFPHDFSGELTCDLWEMTSDDDIIELRDASLEEEINNA